MKQQHQLLVLLILSFLVVFTKAIHFNRNKNQIIFHHQRHQQHPVLSNFLRPSLTATTTTFLNHDWPYRRRNNFNTIYSIRGGEEEGGESVDVLDDEDVDEDDEGSVTGVDSDGAGASAGTVVGDGAGNIGDVTSVEKIENEEWMDEGNENGSQLCENRESSERNVDNDGNDYGDEEEAEKEEVGLTTDGGESKQTVDEEEEEGEDNDEREEALIEEETASTSFDNNHNYDQNEDEEDDITTASNDKNKTVTATSSSSSFITETINSKQTEASMLRLQGKKLHDDGDFKTAAETFEKAASELDYVISIYTTRAAQIQQQSNNDCHLEEEEGEGEQLSHSDFVKLSEERATCRLHQALCHLKNKNYADSIISCTDVLMDGVQVVPLTDEEEKKEHIVGEECDEDGEHNDEEEEETHQQQQQVIVVRICPNGGGDGGGVGTKTPSMDLSPAIRARAYHRRAKARLAFGDSTGALDDARSAAFLGDRNAVALYGKLMRESGSKSNFLSGNSLFDGGDSSGVGGDFSSLFSPTSSASPLQSLLAGVGDPNDSAPSFDMLSSMMGGIGEGNNSPSPLGALGGLGSLLQGKGNANGGGMDTLAKSVLISLTKRIEDESTQEMVCGYLNGVDATQISSLSSMAGVPLSETAIERIVKFANGVTPKGMRKTITLAKRLLFIGNIMRKTFQVIGKYKHLIVVMVLIAWIKSAILRPVVVSKKAIKKAAKAASKATLLF